jgi:YidC/Oxa1 family membrane protein insertase
VFHLADTTALKQGRTVTVVGKHFIADLSTQGAVATAWHMRDYVNRDSTQINLIPEKSGGLFNLHLNNRSLDYLPFDCQAPDTVHLKGTDTIVFRHESEEGWWAEKVFCFSEAEYDMHFYFNAGNIADNSYRVGWLSGIRETEENLNMRFVDDPINVFFGDDVDNPVDKEDTLKEVEGLTKWISLRSKYFSGTLMPKEAKDWKTVFRKVKNLEFSNNELNFSFLIHGKIESEPPTFRVILCPNKYAILKSFDMKLEKILFKGYAWFFKADIWFPPLCGLVLYILNFFYSIIPNYGVSIIFLTILSKIVTYPLTLKSSRSMARMKTLQPKIQAIKDKYKSNPLDMNKATMNLYKEEGVNPLGAGGCLPMILQMPIFISLFVTLRKSIELRGAPFMLWINDLSGPEAMFMLPSKILFYGPNVSLLTIIMAVSMYFQSKQTMTDPKQRSMVIIMPVVMLFMLNSMPAGLILYWALSNILTIVQNALIKPSKLPPPKPKKKKKTFKPLSYSEMVKRIGRNK